MNALRLFPSYLLWHYSTAYGDLLRITQNSLWFCSHFFSVRDTLSTFFEPWQRLQEKYRKGFDIGAWFSSFVVNMLMRGVGVLMRTVLLFFALITYCMVLVVAFLVLALWSILPFLLVGLLFISLPPLFR